MSNETVTGGAPSNPAGSKRKALEENGRGDVWGSENGEAMSDQMQSRGAQAVTATWSRRRAFTCALRDTAAMPAEQRARARRTKSRDGRNKGAAPEEIICVQELLPLDRVILRVPRVLGLADCESDEGGCLGAGVANETHCF